MFQQLATLLGSCEKLVLTLAPKGEQMTVLVAPTVKGGTEAGLSLPLVLTATPAELDAGFLDALAGYTSSRRSLSEQVEATTAVLDAAKTAQTQIASKAIANAGKSKSTPQLPNEGSEGEDEDELADGTAEAETAPVQAPTSDGHPPESKGTDLAALLDD
ncbi:PRTRC system protein E [Cupriavidus basilensis]|uniref:PRTRC system protein E n=1 Tax=Cupriavidus basilensis TaxID=68895 RepID=UPI0039F6CEB0